MKAWVGKVNAAGGLHCHPVSYIVADDGGDPSRHQAAVRQLVEQKHVIAMVYMGAPLTGQSSVSYLTERGIPVIGSEGGSEWFYSSPVYFPQVSSGLQSVESMVSAASVLGKSRGLDVLGTDSCIEASLCSGMYDLAPGFANKFGLKLAYRARSSFAQPDFTSECQAAKNAGVQLLVVVLDGNAIQRFARSCQSVNYKPAFIINALAAIPGLASDPNLGDLSVSSLSLPWMVTTNPSVAEYAQALRQYVPGHAPDPSTMIGWVSAKLFELANATVPPVPTSQAILEGLGKVKDNDLGGITAPLTFTQGQNATRSLCSWLVSIEAGQYATPDQGQRHCYPV